MPKQNPYLNFDRNCREAMLFYRDCLGGDLMMQTVSEMPAMAEQIPAECKSLILHASLTSGEMVIMASDMSGQQRIEGNTIHICIHCESNEQLDLLFGKLASGGTITEPVADMPWGGRYGALTDKYGKHWIFNYQQHH